MINNLNNTLKESHRKMLEVKDSQVEAIASSKLVLSNLELIGVPNSVLDQIRFDINTLESISLKVPSLVVINSIMDIDKAQTYLAYVNAVQPLISEFQDILGGISNTIGVIMSILEKDINDIKRECVMMLLQANIIL